MTYEEGAWYKVCKECGERRLCNVDGRVMVPIKEASARLSLAELLAGLVFATLLLLPFLWLVGKILE